MLADGEFTYSDLGVRDLKLLVERGESVLLEFKRTIPSPDKIAREIGALANTHGGMILVGVDDDGSIVGIKDFFEEEYWIRQAAEELCKPSVAVQIEIIPLPDRDVMLVRVEEATDKPVFVKAPSGKAVYVRKEDESVLATGEMVHLLKRDTGEEPIHFEYGNKEQQLFRFLHEYGEISVRRYSDLVDIPKEKALSLLTDLVRAGILSMHQRDHQEYFCFSHTV